MDLCMFLTLVGSVHFLDLCRLFDLSWVRPLCGHESWSLVGSVHLVDLCMFLTLVGFVHFLDLCTLFDHSWVRPLCGHESWSLAGSIHLVGLCKPFTLVGSVHFVDMNFDPPWGPSTLWTYVSFDPCWVRLLCGQESWSPAGSVHLMGLRKFFTLVGSVHFVDMNLIPRGVRPPCGLM